MSKGTVSNVFSKKRAVSPEVARQVKKAAKKLNYRPDHIAQSLATKKTMTIGLKIPQYDDYEVSYFETKIINSIVRICSENGYKLLLDRFVEDEKEFFIRDPVDGIILLNPRISDVRIEHYQRLKFPFVVIGRPENTSDVYFVDNNNYEIVREVTEHLISEGHKKILFLNAAKDMTVAEDRKEGYYQAFINYGLDIDDTMIVYNDPTKYETESGYGFENIIKHYEEEGFSAVITDTDRVAFGVLRAINKLKLKSPEDMSIIALSNNYQLSLETSPQLTSVELHPEKLGAEATLTLLGLLNDKLTPREKIVNANIVIRES